MPSETQSPRKRTRLASPSTRKRPEQLAGQELQCVGPVVPSDDAYPAGLYEVGTFYKQGEDKTTWQPVEIHSPAAASR